MIAILKPNYELKICMAAFMVAMILKAGELLSIEYAKRA